MDTDVLVPDAGDGAPSSCGNLTVDQGEACDGTDFAGTTCLVLGYDSGELACDPFCTLDESACSTCNNGIQEGGEDCDGSDLAGGDCISLGFLGGPLACASNCVYDIGACFGCGDGVVNGGEQCDGTDFAGASCISLGYDGGTLACGTACDFDPGGCTTCGDGVLETGEECDNAGANSDVTPDACRSNCVFPGCGDGVCDTIDLGQACPVDCSITVFSETFEGGWSAGWTADDNADGATEGLVDTWAPSTKRPHNGSQSAWCAEDGSNSSNYDDDMQSWAAHTVDLSAAAGQAVYLDAWIWVHVAEPDDWFSMITSNDNGVSWPPLETFDGDTGGWVFRTYDVSFGAGNADFRIGMFFYADGSTSNEEGAYVDDITVRRVP